LVPTQFVLGAKIQLDHLTESRALIVAPYLLQSEFISTVRSLERRGRLDPVLANRIIDDFWALPIRYDWDSAWVTSALQIARSIGASRIYDSIYLACAESYGFTLYTCDESFVRAFDALPPSVNLIG
jgi:predicted nucleic acid-binding protein